ncbi:MAG: hypothetical protein QG597_4222 [Actinomycetota bacterium]|nr:hypothetical protein [Actinomycetota bacterium]
MILVLGGCSSQDAADPAVTGASGQASQAPSATASDVDDLDHSNNFDIYPGVGVTSIAYEWNGDYAITPDQAKTWKGVTAGYSPDNPEVYEITATAGRQADDTHNTFNWFKAQAPVLSTTDAEGECSLEYWAGTDGYQNFAFAGTLTINGKAYPMALSQYGSDDGNQWAFGGPGWQGPMCGTSFATPDGAFAIINREGSGSNYSVTINAL